MAVRVTSRGGIAVVNEGLWATDPEFGLVPDSADDQTVKLQAFLDALTAGTIRGRRVGRFPPGVYRKSAPLTLNNTDGHKPVYLQGMGAQPGADSPVTLRDTVDSGAGTYSFNHAGTVGYFDIRGIALGGSLAAVAKGDTGWGMGGWRLKSRCWVDDIAAQGYDAGLAIWGDHITGGNINVQGNVKGIDIPANIPTQGDNRFRKVQAGGNARAGIAVAKSSPMAGFTFEFLETSAQPIGIWRYDDGTTEPPANWIVGVDILEWSTEYIGTGVVYDDVADGAGIQTMRVDHGTDNWSLYVPGNEWPGKTKHAAWYCGGPISDVQFLKSMPRSFAVDAKPGLKASALTHVRCRAPVGNATPGALANGARVFEITGSQGSALRGSYMGDTNGPMIVPMRLSGSVARGECLARNNDYGAIKWSEVGGANALMFAGIAGHAGTDGQTMHALTGGREDIQVLNTSGVSIDANELLLPDPNGGVAGAGTTRTGKEIGKAGNAAIASGALGGAEIFPI